MTVISTLLTKHCTVHCTDSFITARKPNGDGFDYIETQKSKIIAVEKYHGAMSYFHLALMPANKPQWNTFEFLEKQALSETKPATAEEFARNLKKELDKNAIKYCKQANMGIGIHFTAYEEVNGYQIPEMFYISNISGIDLETGYYKGFDDHFSLGRHSYFTMTGQRKPVAEEHRNPEFRLAVKAQLDLGQLIWFNNGDPAIFNQTASGLATMSQILAARHMLNDRENPIKFYTQLALQPVKIVSKVQSEFCKENMAVVGGKCHQLTITPAGKYSCETGISDIGGFRLSS